MDQKTKNQEPTVITIKIEEELLQQIDAYAKKTERDRSKTIRLAITQYLKKEEENETQHKTK